MKIRLLSLAAVAGITLAACGGSTGSLGSVPAPNPGAHGSSAKGTLTMRVPMTFAGIRVPSERGVQNGKRKPMFVDGNSNGAVNLYFDGTNILDFSSNTNPQVGPGPSGSGGLSYGGSYSWTSQIGQVGNQFVATVNVSYSTIPGPHTIAAVQTNGQCDVGQDPCWSNNDGYVIAEGKTTALLQPGSGNSTTLYLQGVMESAYLCDTACDGGSGQVDSNGDFDINVYVADENGTAIPYQVEADGTTVVPFDNGSYQIVTADNGSATGDNILSITQPQTSYSTPGQAASGNYGEGIKLHCLNVGSTIVQAQLLSSDPSKGNINAFNYTANNYPAAGSVLSTVGSDQYFGNTLHVLCNANGNINIQ